MLVMEKKTIDEQVYLVLDNCLHTVHFYLECL